MTLHKLPSGGPLSPASIIASLPSPMSPKDLRAALSDEIERMIAMLDAIDGDPDLEPDLAGSPNQGAPCDAEADGSDLELSGDENEPSLGSLCGTGGRHPGFFRLSQLGWSLGNRRDLEGLDREDDEDGGDDEPDNPDEPSLGSLDHPDQERWGHHADACTWNVTDGEPDDSNLEDGGDTEPNGDERDGDAFTGQSGFIYWQPAVGT